MKLSFIDRTLVASTTSLCWFSDAGVTDDPRLGDTELLGLLTAFQTAISLRGLPSKTSRGSLECSVGL
jgi:hypothetical protein